jgi:hypothetical protein
MKKLLTLFLLVSTLAAAGVKTNYFNASPMVVSNLLVQSGITLGSSNITDWSQIGGGGAGSVTNIAAGYGISISSGYGPEATVTVNTNIIASQAWVSGQGFTTLAQVWSAGALTNNWTGGAIVLDAANANTNTFGGFLVIGPARYQANGATASGEGSWANFYALASGVGAWANNGATASGEGSWAMGVGAVATNDSFAFGAEAKATNTNTFVWSDETTPIGSTMNKQFTVYAANGYRLLGGPIEGNGSGLTNIGYATSSGIASNLHSGSATSNQVATANGSGGTFWTTPAAGGGGGITAFYWPHSRGVIPSGSGATRYGTDYQFTSFPTLTNSVLTFWNLPIVNTVSNLAVWSSAASGVATTTYLFAFAAYDGTTNDPSYTITNYVTAISGASKITSNCTTAITPGTWTMKMFPVDGSTNSLLSTVEGNIQ